ncbi:helix-turn-helix domain-containing protein [Roseibium aggregatum]|uniref:helix-turn-helix domain-containing protein n=1 Tax=Roseibium aggregatum TaxID=187304 RepID=UPI003A9698B3
MGSQDIDKDRGDRLTQAMRSRGHRKAMALAAELNISPAAITKWKQGHAMSIENACNLANFLDISLDWLLLGRNGPDWLLPNNMSKQELELVEKLRARPARIVKFLLSLVTEIPEQN